MSSTKVSADKRSAKRGKKRRRKGSGQLVWCKSGWRGRITRVVDGENVRILVPLHTTVRIVAARKLAQLVKQLERGELLASEDGSGLVECFADAAARAYESRVAAGVKSVKEERGRLQKYVLPHIGELPVTAVTVTHINAVLDATRDQGMSKQTVVHVRQAMRAVFGMLKREGVVTVNPVQDAELPRMKVEPRKERAILTDEELLQYLNYEPETARELPGVRERQVLACVARMFGGVRTGSLHALRWGEHLDTESFSHGVAPRKKGERPQMLEIPEMLRPTLRAWWEHQGAPDSGPVFPQRRGRGAGKPRNKQSHAAALRSDLMRMMGVELRAVREGASGPRSSWARTPQEQWTQRERVLFSETAYSLPVDFHSFRRAFNTGLADAGVNVQTAMHLAGHTSTAAHMRYVMSRVRRVPQAALPTLGPKIRQPRCLMSSRERRKLWRPQGDAHVSSTFARRHGLAPVRRHVPL